MTNGELERLNVRDGELFWDDKKIRMDQNKINGYRDLCEDEIDLINAAKDMGSVIGDFCYRLSIIPAVDQRWLAIARTEFQKASMFLVRAIAKPEGF